MNARTGTNLENNLQEVCPTQVVNEINGHREKRSSEIITPKMVKGFNNNITQTKCHDKHYLNIFCYLVCVILLLTLLRYERFEDHYLCDHPCTTLSNFILIDDNVFDSPETKMLTDRCRDRWMHQLNEKEPSPGDVLPW